MDDFLDHSVAISRLHFPVTALGPGTRAGVWFQGCSIQCNGCISLDTWEPGPEHLSTVRFVVDWIVQQRSTGITISGGEPFDQPDALHLLIETVRKAETDLSNGVLVYSGYSYKRLFKRFPNTLDLIDVLISGPFIAGNTRHRPLVGSDNQEIRYLNSSFRALFTEYLDSSKEATPFQVQVADDSVWLIGIPQPGDMQKLVNDLQSNGIELGEVSWRT